VQLDVHDINIINTTTDDISLINRIFEQAIDLQRENGYKVWESIDKLALQKDIDERLQYKLVKDVDILCLFSIQFADPLIWRNRDQNDAIYIHRMVVNPYYKGQKLFQTVLNWVKQLARQNNLQFIRMDTWADNFKIIEYYRSFGFEFIENYTTEDAAELPSQNRNLQVALLEMDLWDEN
jgi:ribosomal protein S18 acetylase RimI-like enzyme